MFHMRKSSIDTELKMARKLKMELAMCGIEAVRKEMRPGGCGW